MRTLPAFVLFHQWSALVRHLVCVINDLISMDTLYCESSGACLPAGKSTVPLCTRGWAALMRLLGDVPTPFESHHPVAASQIEIQPEQERYYPLMSTCNAQFLFYCPLWRSLCSESHKCFYRSELQLRKLSKASCYQINGLEHMVMLTILG